MFLALITLSGTGEVKHMWSTEPHHVQMTLEFFEMWGVPVQPCHVPLPPTVARIPISSHPDFTSPPHLDTDAPSLQHRITQRRQNSRHLTTLSPSSLQLRCRQTMRTTPI